LARYAMYIKNKEQKNFHCESMKVSERIVIKREEDSEGAAFQQNC
jgi:hypothetical protein